MSYERPSQKKVVGVARRYLRDLERIEVAEADLSRFKNEELTMDEASFMGARLAYAAIAGIILAPVHSIRQSFLEFAREVEGKKPGEERLAIFALNKLTPAEQERFPLVMQNSQGEDRE